jgi:hypothetical protein
MTFPDTRFPQGRLVGWKIEWIILLLISLWGISVPL